ncbi:MAG: acetate--CoA ligase family protein [Pararhizobium sp.]
MNALAQGHRLDRLLRPRSIAVIGGVQAAAVVEQSLKMGFAGEIWPVHPTKETVAGLTTYRSVEDLPDAPDAAFVGVNRHRTIEVVGQLAARGAGGAVCFAAGFLEAGDDAEGAGLQQALLEAAGGMPIIGPNCYGLINYCDGALLWPDQHGGVALAPGRPGVAILTQSSNIAINLTMQRRGLPLAYVMTAGNQAQTGLSEMALGLIEDERVSVLGLHIEGFDSVAGFERLAARARDLRKPVVAMKVGRSEQARAATILHTASLAGSDAASDAFLKRLGIARVHAIPAFLETLKLLHVHGPLAGFALSSMSCSGGEASLIADAAEGRRAYFAALDPARRAAVKETLGPLVAVANPLDYHTFIWNDEPAMSAAFSAFVGGDFALNMVVLDFPRGDRCSDADWWPTVKAFETALKTNSARGAVVASMPENMPEAHADALISRGIAPLQGITEALDAAEAAAAIGEAWLKPPALPLGSPISLLPEEMSAKPIERDDAASRRLSAPAPRRAGLIPLCPAGHLPRKGGDRQATGARQMDEADAKALLAAAGLPVRQGRRVADAGAAAQAAREIGYPVAVKALGVAHKSERGAVRLGLGDAASVEEAATALAGIGDGLLVEPMISGGIAELIVGVTRDPLFGPVMTIGSGGVLVELLSDSRTLLLPAALAEIEEALRSLKLFALLDGYRSRRKADIRAAIAAIAGLAQFASERAASIVEMDVNPLIVCGEGEGAWIADALIVMEKADE